MIINEPGKRDALEATKAVEHRVSRSEWLLLREAERQYRTLQQSGMLDAIERAMDARRGFDGVAAGVLGRLTNSDALNALSAPSDALKAADIRQVIERTTGGVGEIAEVGRLVAQLSKAMQVESPIAALLAQVAGATVAIRPEEWATFRSVHLPALDGLVASTKLPNPILASLGEQYLGSTKELESLAASIAESNRSLTLLAERSLGRIDWLAIGGEAKAVAALRSTMDDFERSYGAFLSSLTHAPAGVLSLPPALTRLPAVEYFAHGDLASGLWAPEPEEDEQRAEIRERIDEETDDALDRLLAEVDPGLVEVRHGVVHALETRGPDWRRHCVSSLRELFGHVLRAKAPDDAVRKWSKAPKHYAQGRPTRAGRLQYLYREIRVGEFEGFIDADVGLTLKMMDALHKGTHEVSCDFKPAQVSLLRLRVEAMLRLLLELDR